MADRDDRVARLRAAAVWLRSPSLWRGLLVAGSVVGVFLWAIVVLGIALSMAQEGAEQWWLVLVFGLAILALVLAGAYLLAARLFNRPGRPPAQEAGRAPGAAGCPTGGSPAGLRRGRWPGRCCTWGPARPPVPPGASSASGSGWPPI